MSHSTDLLEGVAGYQLGLNVIILLESCMLLIFSSNWLFNIF